MPSLRRIGRQHTQFLETDNRGVAIPPVRGRGAAMRNQIVFRHDRAGTLERHVLYHEKHVVCWNRKMIVLRNNGHLTMTTKSRMNQASNQFNLGFRVFARNRVWLVQWQRTEIPFQNGLILWRNPIGVAVIETVADRRARLNPTTTVTLGNHGDVTAEGLRRTMELTAAEHAMRMDQERRMREASPVGRGAESPFRMDLGSDPFNARVDSARRTANSIFGVETHVEPVQIEGPPNVFPEQESMIEPRVRGTRVGRFGRPRPIEEINREEE
jgi:hypothetical protein